MTHRPDPPPGTLYLTDVEELGRMLDCEIAAIGDEIATRAAQRVAAGDDAQVAAREELAAGARRINEIWRGLSAALAQPNGPLQRRQ